MSVVFFRHIPRAYVLTVVVSRSATNGCVQLDRGEVGAPKRASFFVAAETPSRTWPKVVPALALSSTRGLKMRSRMLLRVFAAPWTSSVLMEAGVRRCSSSCGREHGVSEREAAISYCGARGRGRSGLRELPSGSGPGKIAGAEHRGEQCWLGRRPGKRTQSRVSGERAARLRQSSRLAAAARACAVQLRCVCWELGRCVLHCCHRSQERRPWVRPSASINRAEVEIARDKLGADRKSRHAAFASCLVPVSSRSSFAQAWSGGCCRVRPVD